MRSSLRVMTYNVRQLKDDRAAVLAVLRAAVPDVVAVQEPPRGPFARTRLRRLAADAGLDAVVVGSGARTTALLVRQGLRVTGTRAVRLSWRPGRTRRGLAVADVAGVRVVSVHLSLDPAERARHLDRLLLVVRSGDACVVAGDLNEKPGGPARRRLGLHLHDLTGGAGPTYPAKAPVHRIDAVLATSGLTGDGAHVVVGETAARASDHCAVVVELGLT
ncbi:endonuclease/exonuclease/phosphatase family protein [Cellulomonas sp. KRMCY2]|uniref:endonuclease/exonuclease/phosphatase family protein n=1 Tax=Cellulomonas sp. KRMCY2 TaxID=1304865 RepID=UPI0018CC1198|nr:endonuclease/exonuclease/phosphatase family protein [Cellulomonas sp. KRMCY2]